MGEEDFKREVIHPDDVEDTDVKERNFKVPEEYANEAWASVIKDEETLWKNYANAQKIIGKKEIVFDVPDFEKLESEKINEYFQKLVPDDLSKYPLDTINEKAKEHFSNVFKEAGVAVPQASKLIEGFSKYEQEQLAQLTSKEDYENRMKNLFGVDFQKSKKPIDSMLSELLTAEDMKLINDNMPNQLVEVMYKISKGVYDKFGYKETGKAAGEGGGVVAMTKEEKLAKHEEYTKQLQEINSRNHTAEEKQAIINKIVELNK